jgi:hypothetical protein
MLKVFVMGGRTDAMSAWHAEWEEMMRAMIDKAGCCTFTPG